MNDTENEYKIWSKGYKDGIKTASVCAEILYKGKYSTSGIKEVQDFLNLLKEVLKDGYED